MVSKVVDEKIIELGLDDSKLNNGLSKVASKLDTFTSGVKSKMSSVNLDGATDSINKFQNGLSKAVEKIPLIGNGLSKSLGGVGSEIDSANKSITSLGDNTSEAGNRFSILGTAASVALGTIEARAAMAGAQLLRSMTVQPLLEGWNLYEQKIQSVNMLTHALGEDQIDHITAKLGELQQYAQTTRYAVGDMNDSLAQFVNAGVGIDQATVAIKGYGNLAASAGASTQEFAASLKFGVQQALQMGYMNRQNWMSIQNAHMATNEFKQSLIELGKANGTVTDAMIEKYGGLQGMFADAMAKESWLTNDVLMQALERLANDKSLQKMASDFHTFREAAEAAKEGTVAAWANVWEELFGRAGSEQVTEFWTKYGTMASNALTSTADGALEVAKNFSDLGGYEVMLTLFDTIANSVNKIRVSISGAFKDVFPDSALFTAQGIIDAMNTLIGKFRISKETAQGLHSISELLFRLFAVSLGVIRSVTSGIAQLIPDGIIGDVIQFAGHISDMLLLLGELSAKFISGIIPASTSSAFREFGDIINNIYQIGSELVNIVLTGIVDKLSKVNESFKGFKLFDNEDASILQKMNNGLSWFLDTLRETKSLSETVGRMFKDTALGDAYEYASEKIQDVVTYLGDLYDKAKDAVGQSKLLQDIFDKISKFKMPDVSSILGVTKVSADEVDGGSSSDRTNKNNRALSDSKSILDGLSIAYRNAADAIGEFISNSTVLTGAFVTIKQTSQGLWDGITSLDFSSKSNFILSAVNAISDGFKKLLDAGKKAGEGVGSALTVVRDVVKGLYDDLGGAGGIVNLYFMKQLIDMLQTLFGKQGLISNVNDIVSSKSHGIAGVFGGLKSALDGFGASYKAEAFKSMATGIGILAASMWVIAQIPADKLGPASLALMGVITTMAGAYAVITKMDVYRLKNMGGIEGIVEALGIPEITKSIRRMSSAMYVTSLAAAVMMVGKTLKDLGDMSWDQIMKGVTAVGIVIAELTGGSWLAQLGGANMATGLSLLALSKSIDIIVDVMNKLIKFKEEDLSRAEVNVGLIAGILAASVALMNGNFGAIGRGIGVTMNWGQAGFGTAATILSMAKGIKDIVSAMSELAAYDPAVIDRGVKTMEALMASVSRAIALMSGSTTVGVKANTGTLIPNKYVNSALNVGFGSAWGNVTYKSAATLFVMIQGVKNLMGAFKQLDGLSTDEIDNGIRVVKKISSSVARAVALISANVGFQFGSKVNLGLSSGNTSAQSVAQLAVMIGGLKILADEVIKIAKLNVSDADLNKGLGVIDKLGLTLIAITGAFTLMGKFGTIGSSVGIGSIVAAAGSLFILAQAVMSLTKYSQADLKKASDVVTGIGWTLTAIVGIVGALGIGAGLTGAGIAGMAVAFAGMVAVAGSIVLVANAFTPLSKISASDMAKAKDAIGFIADTLTKTTAITSLVGGFTSFGAVGAMVAFDGMVNVAEAITKVAKVMKPLSEIDTSGMSRAKQAIDDIANVLMAMTNESMFGSVLQNIGGFIKSKSMDNVASAVEEMSKAFVRMSKIDTAAMDLAQKNIQTIVDYLGSDAITTLFDAEGSLWERFKDMFSANSKIDTAVGAIEKMAKTYSKLADLDENRMKLAEANINKIITKLTSESFKKILTPAAIDGISGTSSSLASGYNTLTSIQAIKDIANSYVKLADLGADKMDTAGRNVDTIIAKLTSKSFKKFVSETYKKGGAEDLKNVLTSLKTATEVFSSLSEIGSDKMNVAKVNMDTLEQILNRPGFKKMMKLDRDQDPKGLTDQFTAIKDSVMPMIDSISKIKIETLTDVEEKFNKIKKLVSTAKGIGQDKNKKDDKVEDPFGLDALSKQIEKIGTAFEKIGDAGTSKNKKGKETNVIADGLKATISEAIQQVEKVVTSARSKFSGLGKGLVEAIVSGFKTDGFTAKGRDMSESIANGIRQGTGRVQSTAIQLVNAAKSAIGNPNISDKGRRVSSTFADGIRAGYSAVSSAASGISSRAKSAVGSPNISDRGSALSMSYANGIKGAYAAVAEAARKLPDTAKSAAGGGSLYQTALSYGLTYAAGLRASISAVSAAASAFKEAVNSTGRGNAGDWEFQGAGANVAKAVYGVAAGYDYSGINITPTITPVVDMSQIDSAILRTQEIKMNSNLGFNIDFESMDKTYAIQKQAVSQSSEMSRQFEYMSNQLFELAQINQTQARLLEEGKIVNNYMDGTLVNKQLAPGMQRAQDFYTTRLNRTYGEIK